VNGWFLLCHNREWSDAISCCYTKHIELSSTFDLNTVNHYFSMNISYEEEECHIYMECIAYQN